MYLFFYFLAFYLLIFVLRSVILWKKTGINPLTFSRTDDAHSYNGKIFKIISIIELVLVSIHAFKKDWTEYLLPIWYMNLPMSGIIGWGLLLFAIVWIWIAQNHMASSWRIGIDKNNKSELVTHGLFSISRNPVFLGIVLANLGLFFLLPNALTLLVVALSVVTINTQIRLEESFLLHEFGQSYLDYKRKTRRWI